jgi:ABC-type lipoprotein release transport system permease subunit
MGGAQTGTVMGVESVVRSFSSSDVTINSKNLIPRSFSTNLTDIGDGLIDVATPVLAVPERAILHYNATDPPSNSSATIVAIDPETYPMAMSMTFTEDTPLDVFDQLNNSGTIILTTPLAQSLQVKVDDILELRQIKLVLVPLYTTIMPPIEVEPPSDSPFPGAPPSTPPPQIEPITIVSYVPSTEIISENFTVIGIAQGAWLEMASIGGHPLSEASYISYNSLNNTFPKHYNNSNMFFIKSLPDKNVDEIKDEILNLYGKEYELSATTYNDSVERVSSSIDEIFYILYSVVIFAVANSAIGVAAIMIMNVSERKREIGIFRSQGMSRGQVVVSIFGEAACLGFIGFLSGTAIGLIFHRITVSYMSLAGFPMPYIIPYDAIWISLLLAIITAITSAVYAANRASKLNIVESLRT